MPLEEGPVFRNQETPAGRVQGWPTKGHALPVPDLPGSWRGSRAWSLVPVASELGDAWAGVVQPGAFTSLAWQGLLREQGPDRLTVRRPPGPSRLLDVADLVGVSRHDLAPGVGVQALVELLRPGARLAVTDGHDGGRLIRAGSEGRGRAVSWAAIPPERLVDPTGAGDVFLAALAAAIVRPDLTSRAGRRPSMAAHLEFAAAAASFVVEAPGLQGVPTREAVLARLASEAPRNLTSLQAIERRRSSRVRRRSRSCRRMRSASSAGSGRPIRRRRSTSEKPRNTAAIAPGRSPRRCSWSLASSIAATMAPRPVPAAIASQATAASP